MNFYEATIRGEEIVRIMNCDSNMRLLLKADGQRHNYVFYGSDNNIAQLLKKHPNCTICYMDTGNILAEARNGELTFNTHELQHRILRTLQQIEQGYRNTAEPICIRIDRYRNFIADNENFCRHMTNKMEAYEKLRIKDRNRRYADIRENKPVVVTVHMTPDDLQNDFSETCLLSEHMGDIIRFIHAYKHMAQITFTNHRGQQCVIRNRKGSVTNDFGQRIAAAMKSAKADPSFRWDGTILYLNAAEYAEVQP